MRSKDKRLLVGASLLALLALLATVFGDEILATIKSLSAWVDGQGALAPVFYVVLYMLIVVLLLPTVPLILIAGVLFGLWPGVLYALLGNFVGGMLAFWLARSRFRDMIKALIIKSDLLDALDTAIGRGGFRTAILLRMSPLLPGSLLNYALGLTTLTFRDYLLASLGTVPVVSAYTLLGSTLGSLQNVGDKNMPFTGATIAALVLGVLATLIVTVFLTRRVNSALAEKKSGATKNPA